MLTGTLIQGTFPQYGQLVPTSFEARVSFSVPPMVQRLNMMDDAVVSSGIVRLSFHKTELNEDIMDVSAGNSDEISYSLHMPVKIEAGGEAQIAFNKKYVVDAIKPFSLCHLELTSPSSPGKFTGDIEELTVVCMPMFVQW